MPRLKPINFDLIKAGNAKEITKMTEDLCRTRPRGANRNLRDERYVAIEHWNPHYRHRLKSLEPENYTSNTKEGEWGYTAEQIYTWAAAIGAEGKRLGEYQISSYVTHKLGWSGAKRTRRVARLYGRTADQYKRFVENNMDENQLFTIQRSFRTEEFPAFGRKVAYNIPLRVRARSEDDATNLFNTLFGHVWPEDGNYWSTTHASFAKLGDESDTVSHNAAIVESLQKRKADLLAAKEKLEEELLRLEMGIESIQTFNISQFGAE